MDTEAWSGRCASCHWVRAHGKPPHANHAAARPVCTLDASRHSIGPPIDRLRYRGRRIPQVGGERAPFAGLCLRRPQLESNCRAACRSIIHVAGPTKHSIPPAAARVQRDPCMFAATVCRLQHPQGSKLPRECVEPGGCTARVHRPAMPVPSGAARLLAALAGLLLLAAAPACQAR